MSEHDEPLATLEVSGPRSFLGIAVTVLLGALMFWIALTQPPREPYYLVLLALIGLGSLWAAYAMFRASQDALILTRTRLVSRSGVELCRLDNVKSVDRGALAFKPSGGFLLRLTSRHPFSWVPGLYWRMGRSIGVGGVTKSAEARAMADFIVAIQSDTIR
jgi:hypothetical protein